MSRVTAGTRIQRLLAILQWAAGQPDGVPITELCDRFGLARPELVKELEMAAMIGADSLHYDEMPFEVIVEDGRVWVRLFSFDRPLRLTPAEGLALVAAADALVADDAADDSPLWRALSKLAALLGIEPGEAVDVDLDPEGGATGRLLAEAIAAGRQVRFTYWSYGRDVVEDRVVDPWRVFAVQGLWYLAGRAVERDEPRRFRLDRMEAVQQLDEPAKPAPADLAATVRIPDRLPQIVLDLPADARWVAEAYPVVAVEPSTDGRLVVTLAVAGRSWLERLLLRLGPTAHVVRIDPELGEGDVLADAAARVLARYR
ncbi:WYL domain-containing protein [Aquihabitans sp. G128]|uniref:transcriptional regulator n=1 Tax=Aquihabitans sp. G128 TaxID=2849779 RepID=UPI001C23A6D0|nr:WYL domain-containing protein [Aquihabitans sp. G128]QXC62034.1 WYL domain-containing protein [Aquihabitans sp. G128]